MFFAHKYFSANSDKRGQHKGTEIHHTVRAQSVTITILLSLVLLLFFSFRAIPSDIVYNTDLKAFDAVDVKELIDAEGWQNAASLLRNSKYLASFDEIGFTEGNEPKPTFHGFIQLVTSPTTAISFMLVFFFAVSNMAYARLQSSKRVGRIFLYSENHPPRPRGGLFSDIWSALLIGTMGSLTATVIIEIIGLG